MPIYQQIKRYIVEKIESGEFATTMKIPSEAKLGEKFHTSRMTVNRALRELTAEGLLVRKQGKGSFVAPHREVSALLEVRSVADEIKKRGGNYSCNVHLLGEEKAGPQLAAAMNLSAYSSVYHSILVHMDGGVPIQLADRFVTPNFAPEYLDQDFSSITPNLYLLSLAPISKVEHQVEALIPDAWVRSLLQINEAEPCLALQRTTWVGEMIATKSCFYYPGSRYSLRGRFAPIGGGKIHVF